jgi:hypothetical protein
MMTQAEWLACTDIGQVHFWGRWCKRISNRKDRLIAVGGCRQMWHLITDWRCRQAIEVAEKFADDQSSLEELDAARRVVRSSRDYSIGHVARLVASNTPLSVVSPLTHWAVEHARPNVSPADARAEIGGVLLGVVRDVLGNPFRLISLDPSWLEWNGGVVGNLAEAIYQERAFDRLPILADALEDAGCDNADLLGHCRGGGEHVRGCWVVDLLLGKE